MRAEIPSPRSRTLSGGLSSALGDSLVNDILPALRERHGVGRASEGDRVTIPSRPRAPVADVPSDIPSAADYAAIGAALVASDPVMWERTKRDVLARLPQRSDLRAAVRANLFVPAARRLGSAWSADEASFVDVTIGMARLQELMDAVPGAPRNGGGPRVLLAPTPGDTHVFGLMLLAEELREGGFSVEVMARSNAAAVGRAVAARRADVLGIGVSVARHAGRAAMLVRAARRTAQTSDVRAPLVVAGGAAAEGCTPILLAAGVDAVVPQGTDVATWLSGLLRPSYNAMSN